MKLKPQQRKQIVDALVTNCGCQAATWNEDDRELLENASDDRLVQLYESGQANAQNELIANQAREGLRHGNVGIRFDDEQGSFIANELEEDLTDNDEEHEWQEDDEHLQGTEDEVGEDGEMIAGSDQDERTNPFSGSSNQQRRQPNRQQQRGTQQRKQNMSNNQRRQPQRPMNPVQWLNSVKAPASVRSAVMNALSLEKSQKAELIEIIVANENNSFSPKYLATKDVRELEAIARLAANTQEEDDGMFYQGGRANYQGAAPATNSSMGLNDDGDEPLGLPTINYKENSKRHGEAASRRAAAD